MCVLAFASCGDAETTVTTGNEGNETEQIDEKVVNELNAAVDSLENEAGKVEEELDKIINAINIGI